MIFFSKIFKNKKNEIIELHAHFYEELVDLIVSSDALRNEVKLKIKLAFEDPLSFYDERKQFFLSQRGLNYFNNKTLTPKFVLVDTILNGNEMAEVDWKEEEQEIRSSIIVILKTKNINITFSSENKFGDSTETSKIIELIDDRELTPLGYSIVLLDINSDSYVFTIVPTEKREATDAMLSKLGNLK